MIAKKMYCGAGIRAELRKYTIRGLAHRDLAKCDRDLAVPLENTNSIPGDYFACILNIRRVQLNPVPHLAKSCTLSLL